MVESYETSNNVVYSISRLSVYKENEEENSHKSRDVLKVTTNYKNHKYYILLASIGKGLSKLLNKNIYFNFKDPENPFIYRKGLPKDTINISNLTSLIGSKFSDESINVLLSICGYVGFSIIEFERKNYIQLKREEEHPDFYFLPVDSYEISKQGMKNILSNFNEQRDTMLLSRLQTSNKSLYSLILNLHNKDLLEVKNVTKSLIKNLNDNGYILLFSSNYEDLMKKQLLEYTDDYNLKILRNEFIMGLDKGTRYIYKVKPNDINEKDELFLSCVIEKFLNFNIYDLPEDFSTQSTKSILLSLNTSLIRNLINLGNETFMHINIFEFALLNTKGNISKLLENNSIINIDMNILNSTKVNEFSFGNYLFLENSDSLIKENDRLPIKLPEVTLRKIMKNTFDIELEDKNIPDLVYSKNNVIAIGLKSEIENTVEADLLSVSKITT